VTVLAETWTGRTAIAAKKAIVGPLVESWVGQFISGSAAGPGAQPSVSVAPLALVWAGQGVHAGRSASIGVRAEIWAGITALAHKTARVSPLAEAWTGQAVTWRGNGINVAPLAILFAGQTVTWSTDTITPTITPAPPEWRAPVIDLRAATYTAKAIDRRSNS